MSASAARCPTGHKYIPDVAAKGCSSHSCRAGCGSAGTYDGDPGGRYAVCAGAYVGGIFRISGGEAESDRDHGDKRGKTTTTYMIKSILDSVGYKVGLIGTIEAIIGEKRIPAANTTPESYTIQQYFAQMVEEGCDCVVMEVSSQGLMLNRTAGIPFEIGIFTNLGHDHIGPNEHKDFDDYKRCKGLLFKQCKVGIANVDDRYFRDVFQGATCRTETFGFSEGSGSQGGECTARIKAGYLGVAYHVSGVMDFDVEIDIPGTFSVYNSLTAISVCRHFNVPVEKIKEALRKAKVKGRIEMVRVSDEFTLMIDYAHNAMSLESLLTTLKGISSEAARVPLRVRRKPLERPPL